MDFSFSSLLAGLLFGVVGVWMIKRGKADANVSVALIGLTLIVYPYFTSTPWVTWSIGLGLCGAAWKLR